MASTTPSPANLADTRQAKANVIRSLIISLMINGAIPFVIYLFLKNSTSISDFWALVITGIPSTIHSIVGVIQRRRVDFLAGIALTGIAISLIIISLGGDPKILLIRESFFTIAFGLALLISLFLPRPIMFYFGRYFAAGNNPASIARFNALWQDENVRRAMRVMTMVWGVGFLLEAAIRIFLVLTLSVAQFLAVSPFVIYGIIVLLIVWTFSYNRAGRQRRREALQGATEQQATPAAPSPTESA